MTKFVSFLKDESGASAAEYVLILALVGIAIIGAASLLGTAMNDKLKSAADTIKNAS
ncbi:MAG TPA: Flp family type IVb pilin [Phenylobacterium sp.]|nr:Flp family type IVb pilin [Phenylobacterium sp.]